MTGAAGSTGTRYSDEDAVRGAFDIGPKKAAEIDGRKRIFDGLTDEAVSEVKNVARQSFTRQLKDSLKFAKDTGRLFDLYVRGGANPTTLSGPLHDYVNYFWPWVDGYFWPHRPRKHL